MNFNAASDTQRGTEPPAEDAHKSKSTSARESPQCRVLVIDELCASLDVRLTFRA
jgi:hypothetical protein